MTGPQIDPFADLSQKDPFADLSEGSGLFSQVKRELGGELDKSKDNLLQVASSATGMTGKLFNTLGRGAKKLGEVTGLGSGGAFTEAGNFLTKKAEEIAPRALPVSASLNDRVERSIAAFIGASVPQIGVSMATAGAINPIASQTLGRVAGLIGGTAGKVASAAATELPGAVLGVAAFGPEQLKEPSGILAAVLPSTLAGAGAVISSLRGVQKLAKDPLHPTIGKDVSAMVDDFTQKLPWMKSDNKLQTFGKITTDTDIQVKSFLADQNIDNFDWFQKAANENLNTFKSAKTAFTKAANKLKKDPLNESHLAAMEEAQQVMASVKRDFDEMIAPYRWNHGEPGLNEPEMIARSLTEGSISEPPRVVTGDVELDEALARSGIVYDTKYAKSSTEPQVTLRQRLFDPGHPLEKLSRTAWNLYNNFGSAGVKAKRYIEEEMALPLPGTRGVTGKYVPIAARPLQKILDPFTRPERAHFDAYLKAKLTIAQPQISTGMALDDAIRIVNKSDPKFEAAAQEFEKVTNWYLDYRVAHGHMTPEAAAEWKGRNYAPNRPAYIDEHPYNPDLKREGTDQMTVSPTLQMADNIRHMVRRVQRNNIWQELIKEARTNPDGWVGQFAPAERNDAMFKTLVEGYKKQGMSQATAAATAEGDLMGVFDRSSNTVSLMVDGHRASYKVSPQMAAIAESMEAHETGLLFNISRALSRPIRESVAAANDLSLIGPASDAVRATAAIKANGVKDWNMFLDPIKAAWELQFGKGIEKGAAINAGLNFGVRGRNPALITEGKYLDRLATSPVKTIGNTPGDLAEWFNDLITPLNSASRFAMYRAQIKAGLNPTQAASFANEALGNFSKIGTTVRRLGGNAVEFGPYQLQTTYQDAQLLWRGMKSPKDVGAPIVLAAVKGITLPTLAALAWEKMNRDDELASFRKASNYTYTYIRNPVTGGITKFKKLGWGLAPIFGGAVEAAWDGMDDDAQNRLAKTIVESYGMNYAPIPLQAGISLLNNQRSPFGLTESGPIIPKQEQGLDPAVQGSEGVSVLGKRIGGAIGVSPYKVDFALDKFLGPVPTDILQFPAGKVGGGRDIPILSRFNVSTKAQTEGSVAFYRDLQAASDAYKTFTRMAQDNDPRLQEFQQEKEMAIAAYSGLASMAKQIGQANTYMNWISRDRELSAEEKQKEIAQVRENVRQYFRIYNEMHKNELKDIR